MRTRGRRNHNGGRGRGRSKSRHSRGKSRGKHENTSRSKKTLGDHIFQVGSAKNASDFVTNSNFIMNHIQISMDNGLDVSTAMKEGKHLDFSTLEPVLQVATADPDKARKEYDMQMLEYGRRFDMKLKAYEKRTEQYRVNCGKAAALVWKQCSPGMRAKLKARSDYQFIQNDPVLLLEAIKGTFNELRSH